MVNLLPLAESKGEYRTIRAIIKDTIKDIRYQKMIIEDEMYQDPIRNRPKLFEVEPSPYEYSEEELNTMTSFFGGLD
jgi:hypothetical protein